MQLSITGRHMEVTPSLKDYISKKIEKLEYYFDHIIDVKVTLAVEKLFQVVEIGINSDVKTFNCTSKTENMYESIDKGFDKIERQVKRFKERIQERKNVPIGEVFSSAIENEGDKNIRNFSKVKRVTPKPMTEHEAILQLALNQHKFVIFNNGHSNDIFVKSIAIDTEKGAKYAILKPENEQWIEQLVSIEDDKLVIHDKKPITIDDMTSIDARDVLIEDYKCDYLIFNNTQANSLDIVYYRNDKTFGLVTSAGG